MPRIVPPPRQLEIVARAELGRLVLGPRRDDDEEHRPVVVDLHARGAGRDQRAQLIDLHARIVAALRDLELHLLRLLRHVAQRLERPLHELLGLRAGEVAPRDRIAERRVHLAQRRVPVELGLAGVGLLVVLRDARRFGGLQQRAQAVERVVRDRGRGLRRRLLGRNDVHGDVAVVADERIDRILRPPRRALRLRTVRREVEPRPIAHGDRIEERSDRVLRAPR